MKNIHLLLSIIILFPSLLLAQVPKTLNFQGVLTNPADGQAVENGTYSFKFEIFEDDEDPNVIFIWEEEQSLTTSDGLYNAVLGTVTPLNIDFDIPYWVEITVEGEILSPRIELTAPGYILNDNFEDLADGSLSGVKVGPGIDGANIEDGTIPNSKLEDIIDRSGFNATGYITSQGGIHVGSTTDPGTANLVVDGTSTLSGNVSTDGDYNYSSAKKRYLTISQAGFVIGGENPAVQPYRGLNPASGYKYPCLLGTVGGTLGNLAYFIASINLPHGAIVTNISVGFWDKDFTYNCTARLIRQDYTTYKNSQMAAVTTSSSLGSATLNTSTISLNTINNLSYSYNLVFETTEANTKLGLYGVRITYTVTNAD